MPLAKLKPTDFDMLATPVPPAPAAPASAPVASPAHLLQQRLADGLDQHERWPARQAVALWVSASLGLWVALLASGSRLLALA